MAAPFCHGFDSVSMKSSVSALLHHCQSTQELFLTPLPKINTRRRSSSCLAGRARHAVRPLRSCVHRSEALAHKRHCKLGGPSERATLLGIVRPSAPLPAGKCIAPFSVRRPQRSRHLFLEMVGPRALSLVCRSFGRETGSAAVENFGFRSNLVLGAGSDSP
jgi:hypothetical protein